MSLPPNPKDWALYSLAGLPSDYFHLIPQSAVRYTRFPDSLPHNSIWDFGRGPGQTMFASLCGELCTSVTVRLYEYLPDQGHLRFCFDGGVETMTTARAIPPSKIHTSMHPTRDGKLIMATHTTARSPVHAYWMFDPYYSHLWEGYPGSSVLEWDPVRRETKLLGIPVPRESIYGAIYDEQHHALWFSTYLRGRLCRLDLTTRQVRDLGQITEFASYCLCKDRLGAIYTASRSGHVFRIDPDTCEVRELGVFAKEPEAHPQWKSQRIMGHHANGPDGRLYMSFRYSDYLYALDPKTLQVERTATFLPQGFEHAPPPGQKGMAFDSQGVLWSLTMRPVDSFVGNQCHLHRWDLLRGGKPECVGLVGTPQRATATISEVVMDQNDVLHIADSNHGEDSPGILAVDTRKLSATEPRQQTRDAAAYVLFADGEQAHPWPDFRKQMETYQKVAAGYVEIRRFMAEQANTAIEARSTTVVRLWERLGRGQAAVAAMHWESDGRLTVWCGPNGGRRLHIRGGQIVEEVLAATDCPRPGPMPDSLRVAQLPSRQGRRHLAQATCWTPWNAGRWLIGTRDGLVACFDPKTSQTFALGAAGPHGPVHQIATNRSQTQAFGVCGDPQDLGHVCCYDDRSGLREVGRTFIWPQGQIVASNAQPTTVAVSPDGSTVAVGVVDELACVYLYTAVVAP